MNQPQFKADRIEVEYRGDELTVWNSLTVIQQHHLTAGELETHYEVLTGDGSSGETPGWITPEMKRKLDNVNIHPDCRILDPNDDEVVIL